MIIELPALCFYLFYSFCVVYVFENDPMYNDMCFQVYKCNEKITLDKIQYK